MKRQFQFDDCYIPSMNQDMLLSEASFILSHDAATGYLQDHSLISVANSYAKNQVGSVYQQLNDGARALDVRPKLLANGTLLCHHGGLTIPVTLERLVQDAIQWCNDNNDSDELVLILHHNFAYPGGNGDGTDVATTTTTTPRADVAVSALSQVYDSLGVNYVQCAEVSTMTVKETMKLAALPSGGYLLAMDQQDAYTSSCAKLNYVQDLLVTCYSNSTDTGSNNNNNRRSSDPCTKPRSSKLQELKDYVMASANNEPTDSNQVLGPPASTDRYPFNELQALWQVDATSAALGMIHLSTLLDDNTKSQLNAHIVNWVYEESLKAISLLAVDQVQLNGNALLSVLRNQCGQSILSVASDNDETKERENVNPRETICGRAIPKPSVQSKNMSTLSFLVKLAVVAAFGIWAGILSHHHRRYFQKNKVQLQALDREILDAAQQYGCANIDPSSKDDTYVLA
ncbi:hypothetical protein IV203_025641 [Nitzschia inconspicua]|uniref:PLC-like phosphodiesterase n=1 Tax=Nitzschia inconspicua TaxID=303405 RepID=A0A9K3PWB8_9STRA|nr:hypothetical protein IV203_025641 [Nitzschia inconspicua]